MQRKRNSLLTTMCAVTACCMASGATLPVVVLPDNPTPVERSAAAELAGELGKCLGETPKIVAEASLAKEGRACRPATAARLFVGATTAAKKARGAAADGTGCRPYQVDEVFLKSVEDGVVMDGDPARAPLYAVDLYLEKYCGVRWWTSDAATYPKLIAAREDARPPVPVDGIELQYAPQFKYRETYYLDGFDPLFKVRSKGNFTSLTRYLLTDINFIPSELGGNHRLYFFKGRRSAYHSFFEVLPPKVYFEKHPDWYSLVNGKREPKQLCLANAEMKAEYIKETLKCLRADPTADFIQVSQNDWRGYCTCEKCKAMMAEDGGAPSGPYLRFANDVAEAVEKEFPNVRIDTFAYQFTRKAPTKTKPRSNVVVRLCDIECDFARPLDKPLPPHKASFAKDLADWRRVAGGNLFIWDYLANFHSYMMPHPNINSIAPNIRLFAENGAVGVFEQGDALCSAGTFATLRHYVTAHLLWDPKDDEKRLMDEFMEGYYGKSAAPILKKFIAVIEAGPRRTKQIVKCGHKGAPFLGGGDKLEAAQLMDAAVAAAAKEGAPFASRVRRERLSVDHMLLLNYDILRDLAAKRKLPWTRPATKAEAVENWIRDVRSFGVKARRETTLADEIDNYFNSLRKGAKPAGNDPFAPQRAEFSKYYKQITGKDAPAEIVKFAIDPKVSKSGRDAYSIVSGSAAVAGRPPYRGDEQGRAGSPLSAVTKTASVQQQVVTITGSNLRSVWYGLYDLLERRGGCHWFWDGDVVPKRDSIDLSNLDVHEEARFEYRAIRYFAHRGLTRFQAEHWGPDDWKKEIDWILKRRLNTFMLRIGQDDLFQRTFPDTCAYPDPAKPLPGTGVAHDDRTLFWSLQYRGKLRDNLQKYAFARGLMVPEDFGTMTHWYSRTPEDFLAKKKPDFIPLANKGKNYQVPNAQVWNIRDDKWVDEYWKMTKTAVESYGRGAPEPRLLHTIGLGERKCYKDKKKNFDMKILALDKFLAKAHTDYPDAKVLLAGWDFYLTWHPDEVKALLPRLDPKRDIIWDYEGDLAPHEHKSGNWFAKWGLVGHFPYTYSMFLAYENALDVRTNYPLIEERQKIVQNDPFCKGYILWPESSHTDALGLRFFTANAWSAKPVPHGDVLDEFCASRYGDYAERMKAAWKAAIPASYLRAWGSNYGRFIVGKGFDAEASEKRIREWTKPVEEACAVFALLSDAPWDDAFVRRDSIDLARMVLDRLIALRAMELCRDIAAWRTRKCKVESVKCKVGDGDIVARAKNIADLCDAMADLLALHTDYSLWESYQRLDAVEKIQNPNFSKTLFENASCNYCRSHQYELARHWYAPHARKMADRLAKAVASGDRAAKLSEGAEAERLALKAKPLESLKPTLPRTQENFRKVMREIIAALADDMDLYLLVGQSNMAGRGILTAENRVETDRVFKLDAKGKWQIADEPIHFDKKVAGAGLAASFARTMADRAKNVKIGLIPCAVGGTGIDRWVEGGDLWSNAVARTRIALRGGTLKGILWHQGEHDATPKGVSVWGAKMESMVKSFRREFGDVPFVAGELGWYLENFKAKGIPGNKLLWREVNAQLHALEGKVPSFRVVSAEGLGANRDILHFNTEALREFGRRYAAAFLGLEEAEQKETFALQHAEFAKYYKQITGKDAPVGAVRFAIDPKISKSGRDAYSIVSGNAAVAGRPPYRGDEQGRAGSPLPAVTKTASVQQQVVTITGSNLRSVWYGLYDLLERRGGCHWFWDGDVVPKRDSIDLSNLDVHEEAHFEYRAIRYFAHRGLTRFQAEHWGLDDWKKEIDWLLKRRLNTFMLRIGQDDVFQRAFPDVCPYPDASKPQPGMYKGYNDRTLFWSLQFRGQLRHDLQKYAFDRGLMSPEDFGTMSHWYSPTPDSFLANKKPPFLPQANSTHAEPHLRVWDIRTGNWAEEYWKLTKTAIDAYDQDAPEPRLLHTIGLGERWCYKDRKANFDLKVKTLNKFLGMAKRDYPDAKLLIAGWDFYSTWKNEEVREYLKTLDKDSVLLWDYEADDAKRGAKARNFTNWDVIGKFPYTYSIFLAYEKALDTRANYEIIEERQKLVQNDPFCKGYILWPESSHTDTLLLRFFTANAWSDKLVPHGDVLDEFCASRYGASAETMKAAWKAALPASWLRDWGNNYSYAVLGIGGNPPPMKLIDKWKPPVEDAQKVFTLLQQVPWDDPFVQRDAIDIARMVLDRLIAVRVWEFGRELGAWRQCKVESVKCKVGGGDLVAQLNRIGELCDAMADLLALHTDYSLWESYQRLDAVEKIRNPAFEKTLFENASCDYCRSHQYELARHWYAPHVKAVAAKLAKAVAAGDRNAEITVNAEKERLALKAKPLESLKPTLPRTAESFRRILGSLVK